MAKAYYPSESSSPTPSSSPPLPAGKDYHVFFCFSIADQEWVDDTISYLESSEIGFKCVDHRRDFHAGKTTIRNIEEFIEKSWKHVLVMTPEFVCSEWCKFETDIMVGMSLEQRAECIIPVLLKPCMIPKAIKFLTYIDVINSDRWRERLFRDIRRTDISTQNHSNISSQAFEESKFDTQKKIQETRKNNAPFKHCIDKYTKEKTKLQLERKSLESDVHNAFSVLTKRLLTELERQKVMKLDDINMYMDKRLSALVQQLDTAKTILASVNTDLDDNAQKNFTRLLDEYEELERRQRETSYTEFVVSDCLVERLVKLMSEHDAGYLRWTKFKQISSQEQRDLHVLPTELSPSWEVLPRRGDVTPWSIIKCSYFQFDPQTIHENRSILPDGSLYNQLSTRAHSPSARRLRKYLGAVATTRFTTGGIYYWNNDIDVNLEEKLERKELIFEVNLSTRGVTDGNRSSITLTGALSLRVGRCTEHSTDSVCMKIHNDNVQTYHQKLHPNTPGHWPSLVFGFLLDTVRNKLTIHDVTKQEEITIVKEIKDAEEFTPMFGVFAHSKAKTKLSLITGKYLCISDGMHRLLEQAIE